MSGRLLEFFNAMRTRNRVFLKIVPVGLDIRRRPQYAEPEMREYRDLMPTNFSWELAPMMNPDSVCTNGRSTGQVEDRDVKCDAQYPTLSDIP